MGKVVRKIKLMMTLAVVSVSLLLCTPNIYSAEQDSSEKAL